MNEDRLIEYYNKFNEDKRLNSRHGQVEFTISMKYIKEYLKEMDNPKIIDIGAGTGKYSIALSNAGYDVTAVELVKHNLRVIEKKSNKVKAYQGNATDLSKFEDNSFDMVLLFGPMYHLIDFNDKIKALNEAKRICKDDGIIMVAYCMNDYAVIIHGFRDKYILDSIKSNKINSNFAITPDKYDLYSFVTIEEINKLNDIADLKRMKIISPDGPSDYIRPIINKLSKKEFDKYIEYVLSICERSDLVGAGSHTLDILKK